MFGRCWSIAMMLFLVGHTTGDALRLIWYQVDRDSFAARYCVNLDRPELACHGRCQLPMLAASQEQEPGEAGQLPGLTLRWPAPFVLPSAARLSPAAPASGTSQWPGFDSFYSFTYAWAPFRPPIRG